MQPLIIIINNNNWHSVVFDALHHLWFTFTHLLSGYIFEDVSDLVLWPLVLVLDQK